MKCPNCGKEIAEGSKFCEFCGTKIGKSKIAMKYIFIAICIVLVLSVIGNILLLIASKETSVATAKLSDSVMCPFIIPNSTNVMIGDSYNAQIVLAAIDTTQKVEYYVNGQRINDDGIYQVSASSIGDKEYTGYAVVTDPNTGGRVQLPFSAGYTVSEPSAFIMNKTTEIMYRGVSHQFKISVPGVPNDKVHVAVSGATINQRGDEWIVTPSSAAKTVTLNVSADVNGYTKSMGSKEYYVKQLPPPTAFFSVREKEYPTGNIAPALLSNTSGTIVASYGNDGLLDVPFTVVSFKTIINNQTTLATGNKFTKAQLDQISRLKKNQMVVLQDICAKGPGGQELRLSPLVLTVN